LSKVITIYIYLPELEAPEQQPFEREIDMKCIQLRDIIPGMILGREIMSLGGVVLLEKTTRLSSAHIDNLYTWGIPFIYVGDEETAGEEIVPGISLSGANFQKEYIDTVKVVRETFEHIRRYRKVPINKMKALVNDAILAMANTAGILYYLHEVQQHSDYTFQHSVNVSVVSGVLGKWLKYDLEDGQNLMLSRLLHDIGKLFIPLPILDKPGKLSSFEFEAIKKHPYDGHKLLEHIEELPTDVKMGILQHHERSDGSGYPDGLTGDNIHRYARVVSIADMYDAMVSDRTYRSKLTPLMAVETIAGEMYNKLDAEIGITFLDNMRNYFAGNIVLLSNGEKAKIIFVDSQSWTKPLVQTLSGTMIDLKKEPISIIDFSGK